MKEKLVKSKERVQKHGEVFTPAWLVKNMLDLLPKEEIWDNIEATILDPACGNGNFLIEVLERKLFLACHEKDPVKMQYNILIALSSVYGVDIQLDNVNECKGRLLKPIHILVDMAMDFYDSLYFPTNDIASKLLDQNIICGNFLTGKKADKDAKDTDEDFHFTFYTFPPIEKLECFDDIKQEPYTLLDLCPDLYKITKRKVK